MVRLLLPFTHGIDATAINSALALAQRLDATLMLLSLVRLSQVPDKGPRWEAIQQSQDFLEFVHHRATRSGVPVERMELYTHNAARSIRALAQEMECAGVVLVVRSGSGVLLATHEVKQLLEDKCISTYIVSLLAKNHLFPLPRWLQRWLGRK